MKNNDARENRPHTASLQGSTVAVAILASNLVLGTLAYADVPFEGPREVEEANVLLQRGLVSEACRKLKEVTMQLPTWWVGHYDYVRCSKLSNPNWPELRGHLLQALKTDPDKASLYYELGTVELEVGNLEAAVDAFNQASKLAPRYLEPRRRIADAYWAMGKLSEARTGLIAQLEENPDDMVAANRLVEVYLSAGLFAEAANLLERIAVRSRFPAQALARLAMVYERLGDMPAYKRTMQRLPK